MAIIKLTLNILVTRTTDWLSRKHNHRVAVRKKSLRLEIYQMNLNLVFNSSKCLINWFENPKLSPVFFKADNNYVSS